MKIQTLKARQTYPLRQHILRPGFTIEACRFPQDDLDASRHFGAYENDQLVGIVTVLQLAEPGQSETRINIMPNDQWQIRALATLPEVRGRGYAAALIGAVENYVQGRSGRLIWCNARRGAVGFYEKQGYGVVGDEFVIAAVGPHFRMKKIL